MPRPRPCSFVLARPAAALALAAAVLFPAHALGQTRPGRPPAGSSQKDDAKRKAEQAIQLHDEARALYEAGEYRKAIVKLEQAAELDPEGKELIYNLALIHEKLGELDPAERYYTRYLDMETDAALRERTQKALKRIEGAKKELEERRAEEARRLQAPAAPPVSSAAAARDTSQTSRRIGPAVWASAGVAAVALLVGNVFAVSALVKKPADDAHTGAGVGIDDLRADAESAHRHAVVADISFIVAGLAAGTGALLYLMTPPRQAAPSKAGSPSVVVARIPSFSLGDRAGVRVPGP